jgi:conjugative transfer signal peptidase TraF
MRKSLKAVITAGCCLTACVAIAILAGVRINTTNSYPRGIYLMTSAPIEKGSLVIFCPVDNTTFRQARQRGYIGAGFCPGGYGYMIKKILAAKNDNVEISALGVFVNGALLPNSKPMDRDLQGRSLSYIRTNIASLDDNSILLMSDYSAKSFDARYFGVIDKSNIISSIRLVWTW